MKGFLRFCAERFRLKKVANIGEKHMLAYVEHRHAQGVAEKTIKEDLSAIRFFHRFSGSKTKLPDNREFGITKTATDGKDRTWTDKEYNQMMEEAERLGRHDVVLSLRIARLAGLRIHECIRLTFGQLQNGLENGEFNVTGKGGLVRSVPVTESLKAVFIEILDGRSSNREDKIFLVKEGEAHKAIKRVQKFLYRHRKKFTARNVTAHGLRHVFAARQYERELDRAWEAGFRGKKLVREAKLRVAKLLGHGRPEVTDIYIKHTKVKKDAT